MTTSLWMYSEKYHQLNSPLLTREATNILSAITQQRSLMRQWHWLLLIHTMPQLHSLPVYTSVPARTEETALLRELYCLMLKHTVLVVKVHCSCLTNVCYIELHILDVMFCLVGDQWLNCLNWATHRLYDMNRQWHSETADMWPGQNNTKQGNHSDSQNVTDWQRTTCK